MVVAVVSLIIFSNVLPRCQFHQAFGAKCECFGASDAIMLVTTDRVTLNLDSNAKNTQKSVNLKLHQMLAKLTPGVDFTNIYGVFESAN